MRSGVKAALWLGAGLVAGFLLWWVALPYFQAPPDPRSVDYLRKVAADINRSVPVMIDRETELLPSQAEPAVLIYNYRLVNYSAAQISVEKFAASAKQKVAQNACNRPETRDDFLKQGVTLRYAYFDKDKKFIAAIEVAPSDCGF